MLNFRESSCSPIWLMVLCFQVVNNFGCKDQMSQKGLLAECKAAHASSC